MHAAPPVRMSLGGDPAWRGFVIVCSAAAAANFAAWFFSAFQQPVAAVGTAALLSAMVVVALSIQVLRRGAAGGVLAWDGATWQWKRGSATAADPGEVTGNVRIMIDLGYWVLLRFEPEMPRRQAVSWLALSRRQAGAAWPQWRAALFARHGAAVKVDPS